MNNSPDVLVVGAGIWGLSTAFHLARSGSCRVRVIERNFDVAQETTINAAGQIGQIRPSPVLTRAIAYALELFESFPDRFGHEAGLVRCGSLFVGLTKERLLYFEQQIARGRANGLRVDQVAPTDMKAWVPGLDPAAILGGYFVHGDGYLDPAQASRALASACFDMGVDFRGGVCVDRIRTDAGRVTGVETNMGPMSAGHVVLAAGPWNGRLLAQAGFALPTTTIRHQRIRTAPGAPIGDRHPVLRVPDLSSYVRPDGDRLIFGYFEPDPTSIDPSLMTATYRSADIDPPIELLAGARQRLSRIYPALGELEMAECRRGVITFAADGGYVVGPVPTIEGLFVGSGCAALGIAGSAAVGRWLAEWILNGKPEEDMREFALDRFQHLDADEIRFRGRQAYADYYAIPSGT